MSTAPPEDNDRSHLVMRMTAHTPRRSISHCLTGRPLSTADASHETIGKAVGLAVFASNALSSNAYATQEKLDHYAKPAPHVTRHRVIMPISGVHQGTLEGLRYARMLSHGVTAVHVSIDPAGTEKLQTKWNTWGDGVRLLILDSPYHMFVEPLLQYVDEILALRQVNEVITIVVPQFVAGSSVENALHMNTAVILRRELLNTPGIVITDVPYQVSERKERQ